ncbi:hypothetical protein B0H16DRAFT_1730458 [Mycena metata]|uniref:Uncharacterized protein n=1 Tax=Mycena metata TaxID=1033252 RepID=A0AAD7I8B8_9AGAR|nr:hypothetical protein B0H16DRAFT_1730458 [Mycena metata]
MAARLMCYTTVVMNKTHTTSDLCHAPTATCAVPLLPLDTPAWTHLQHSVHRHRRAQPPFPIAHAVPHALTLFGEVPPAIHDACSTQSDPTTSGLPSTCSSRYNCPRHLRRAPPLPVTTALGATAAPRVGSAYVTQLSSSSHQPRPGFERCTGAPGCVSPCALDPHPPVVRTAPLPIPPAAC